MCKACDDLAPKGYGKKDLRLSCREAASRNPVPRWLRIPTPRERWAETCRHFGLRAARAGA